VITDTVGFIRDLPKELFAAFRATFEETEDADLLLHVVDVSDPAIADHIRATEHLLGELGLAKTPTVLVLNKADRLPPGDAAQIARGRGGIAVSAMDRASLVPLLTEMESRLFPDGKTRLLPDPTESYVGVASPDDTDEVADDEALVGAAE
jgi:GTP-binding protein HflX